MQPWEVKFGLGPVCSRARYNKKLHKQFSVPTEKNNNNNQTCVSAKPTLMGTPLVIAQSKAGTNMPAPTSASPARAQTCLLTAEGEPGGSRGLCFLLLSGEGSGCRCLSLTGKAFAQCYFSVRFLLEN